MTDLSYRVLVVDDEPDICDLLELTLNRMGIASTVARSVNEAKARIQAATFELCLSDLRLPDGDGIEIVRYLQAHAPTTPIALITAHGDMASAVSALKAGAFDFVSKPINLHMLRRLVDNALRLGGKSQSQAMDDGDSPLLGDTDAIRQLRQTILKVARSQAPVCLRGPSGSGKELAARLIHQQGPRAGFPFVAVNCGAIPEHLLESEFFGHRKGSFTGAHDNRQGLFQAADGGTLFLDEVAELPLNMQVKLLRALQEKAIRSVGGSDEVRVDVRILSATHQHLEQLVSVGKFRQDLYYRINVIEVHVPSLAERRTDIPLLARRVLERIAQEQQVVCPDISADALSKLQEYSFPGNVRELENMLARACALCEGGVIQISDLGIPSAPATTSQDNLGAELVALERERIQQALARHRFNKTATAKTLGMTLRQLRYRLQKLDIG